MTTNISFNGYETPLTLEDRDFNDIVNENDVKVNRDGFTPSAFNKRKTELESFKRKFGAKVNTWLSIGGELRLFAYRYYILNLQVQRDTEMLREQSAQRSEVNRLRREAYEAQEALRMHQAQQRFGFRGSGIRNLVMQQNSDVEGPNDMDIDIPDTNAPNPEPNPIQSRPTATTNVPNPGRTIPGQSSDAPIRARNTTRALSPQSSLADSLRVNIDNERKHENGNDEVKVILDREHKDCSICHLEQSRDETTVLRCGHCFHFICASQWWETRESRGRCAICRAFDAQPPITPSDANTRYSAKFDEVFGPMLNTDPPLTLSRE